MLRDIAKGEDPQITAFLKVVEDARPDVLVLLNVDHDVEGKALQAIGNAIATRGVVLPHLFTRKPNTGVQTGLDLNQDGEAGGPDDAYGYGDYSGQGGMAVLSRYPFGPLRDFSRMLWRDLPDHIYPSTPSGPWGGEATLTAHRLSTTGHWDLTVETPSGPLHLLIWHATPPVFDGPEDRNGRRNHDETAFWLHYLQGTFGEAPTRRFIVIGDANLDPVRGHGRPEAIKALLAHPHLQDPLPDTPTANWPPPGPGRQRVDYILPSADWRVANAGYLESAAASRHTLLWVDLQPSAP